jgi:septal ring factor EnvC (AmiA/AmiB activator)
MLKILNIILDHEDQFAVEMRKYVVPNMTASHSQSAIRHLVSSNVLLKEQLDKQSEEKKSLRKKLLQMERDQSDRERSLHAKQKECAELREKLSKLEHEYETRSKTDDLIGAAIAFKTESNTPSKAITSTPKCNSSISLLHIVVIYTRKEVL